MTKRLAKKKKRKSRLPGELEVLMKGSRFGHMANQPKVTVVPTRFVGFNRATRIGGTPVSCLMLVYGPSQGGKTAFLLGLIDSFQRAGHLTAYVDAELNLDESWAKKCVFNLDAMAYRRPVTYEETVADVERLLMNFQRGQKKKKGEEGAIDPKRCFLIAVDSIHKLVPEEEIKKRKKIGRGFPLRALLNSEWMDRVTPIIHSLPVLFIVVAHEKKKMDAQAWEKDFQIKGGSALFYDSSLVVRIKMAKSVKRKVSGSDKMIEVGLLHEGWVEKNKVGICHESFPFIMGTGRSTVSPIGFDLVQEVMEESKIRGSGCPITRSSSGLWRHPLLPDGKLQGDPAVRGFLYGNPQVIGKIVQDMDRSCLEALPVIDEVEDDED